MDSLARNSDKKKHDKNANSWLRNGTCDSIVGILSANKNRLNSKQYAYLVSVSPERKRQNWILLTRKHGKQTNTHTYCNWIYCHNKHLQRWNDSIFGCNKHHVFGIHRISTLKNWKYLTIKYIRKFLESSQLVQTSFFQYFNVTKRLSCMNASSKGFSTNC